MIGEKKIYNKIAQVIFNGSPDDAIKVIMIASLIISEDGDVARFEFCYIDKNGNQKDFPFGYDMDTSTLRKLLTTLRQSYIDDGQPEWNKCKFSLDIKHNKFEFNIDYEGSTTNQ